ncbi:hypothetical protein SCP_1203650 [Sparassis crispa]|uniref:Uncharacterized protein n=1 Tax=Sparassis crispa TaxID=139825 RepID=A0A401H130_9APHY|nr:hypothetical protein SCP_1203650 [Sparassis crispa]GBE88135.1 hypothetical protein SCP_1203650 [Sparassis crispa]
MVKYDELTRVGEAFRKGSFYVGMVNGFAFEKLAANPTETAEEDADKIVSDINRLPLINAGAFEFFTPIEWLNRGGEGRALICLVYLRREPKAITPEVQKQINFRAKTGTPLFRSTIKKVLSSPSWYEYN